MCHALKHHYIGGDGLARVQVPRAPYESAECEANAFAAHLLIPVSTIQKADYDEYRISQVCGVSWEAASNRVKSVKERDW